MKQTNDVVVDATHLGLEITVSETVLVHVPEALDKLGANDLCVGLRKGHVHIVLQVTVLDVLHRDEDLVLGLVPAVAFNEAVNILIKTGKSALMFPQETGRDKARTLSCENLAMASSSLSHGTGSEGSLRISLTARSLPSAGPDTHLSSQTHPKPPLPSSRCRYHVSLMRDGRRWGDWSETR